MTEPSPRSTIKRLPDRAAYDPDTIYSILDEGFVAMLGLSKMATPSLFQPHTPVTAIRCSFTARLLVGHFATPKRRA